MNRKEALIGVSVGGLVLCALAAWLCSMSEPVSTLSIALWLLMAAGFAGLLVWVFVRKDKIPDYLAALGLNYFEREGLCFAPVAEVVDGQCRMTMFFHNRYTTPCTAEILMVPEPQSAQASLKRVRLRVDCDGAGHGDVSVPWPIPHTLEGRTVTLYIGADVSYPQGRGQMVRFKEGTPVGSLAEVDGSPFGGLLADPAKLKLAISAGVLERASLTPAAREPDHSATTQVPAPGGGTPSTLWASSSKEAGAIHPREPSPSSELGDNRLAKLVASLREDPALRRHRKAVKELKEAQLWKALGQTSLAGLVSAGCLLYLVLACAYRWDLGSRRLGFMVFMLVGLFGFLFGYVAVNGLRRVLADLIRPDALDPAGSLHRACREFYTAAFVLFNDSPVPFVDVGQHFPVPVLGQYDPDGNMLVSMLHRWRDVREHFVPEGAGFPVDAVTVTERPRRDEMLVDVTVCLRGKGFGEVRFRNVALHLHWKWFLATPEPLLVEAECPEPEHALEV